MTNATLVFGGASLAGGALSGRRRLACALAIAAVFALDTLTPLGVAIPFFYVPILWSALQWATRRQVMVMAAACSLLTIIDPVFFPNGVLWMAIVNRTIILMTLWFLLYFGSKYRKLVDTVQTRDRELIDFVENAAVGMNWVGPDGTILWANQEELNMLGHNREDYIGHPIAEFIADREVIEDMLAKLDANVTLKGYEARLRHKDGSLRHVVISANAYFEDGRFIHTRCFIRDITDRVRAEQKRSETEALAAANAQLRAETIERRTAEKVLREHEELLRVTFDTAPVGINIVHRDGTFLKANVAYQRMMGYTEEELRRKTVFDLTHQDDLPRTRMLRERLLKGWGDFFEIEKRNHTKDGKLIWVRTKVSVVKDGLGKLRFTVGVAQDISEQKHAERILAESEERYRYLYEANPMPMWIARGETLQIVAVNDAAVQLYGYTRDEFETMTSYHFQSEDTLAAYEDFVKGRQADLSTLHRRGRHRKKDGSIIDVDITSHPISYAGSPARLVLAQDITERLKAETALREHKELLRITFDTAPVGICIVDTERRFMRANAGYQKLVGYTEEELHAQTTFDLNHPDDTPRNWALRKELFDGKRDFYDIEKRYRTKKGDWVWVRNTVSLVKDACGNPRFTVAVVQDITERKRAEEKLRESEDRYRDLVEHSQDLICTHDLDGRILSVNPWAAKVLGYEQAELVNVNLRDVLASSVRHELDGYLAAIRTDGAAQGLMLVQPRTGGKRVWEYNNTLRTEGVSTPIVRGMAHDITEQLRAKRALEERTAQLRMGEVLAQMASLEWDIEADHLTWSRSPDWLLGPRPASGSYPLFKDMVHPQDRQRFLESRQAALEGLEDHWADYRIIRTDGEVRGIAARSRVLRDTAGRAMRMLVVLQDITERKRAEEDQAWLAAIVETATVAIFTRTLDGTILSWNAGAERLLGYTAAEAIGQSTYFTRPPGRPPNLARNNENLLRGKAVAQESDRMTKDGRVIDVLISHSPIRDRAGDIVGASVILQDMSALKQAQATVRESEQRFRAIFDYAGVGITMQPAHARNHPWVQVNDRFCKLLGYTREELLGLSPADITPADEQARAVKNNERLLRGEIESYVREQRVVRKDGSEIWVMLTVAALPDAEGHPTNIISVYQDINERKRAERELQRQAALAGLLESLAAAANKADTPEQVLAACLERICAYGGWNSGDVLQIRRDGDACRAAGMQWHFTDARARERYSDFFTLTTRAIYGNAAGVFIDQVISTRAPRWIPDLDQVRRGPRLTWVRGAGVRSAFAFPVIVHDEVVACVEFFAAEVREPDTALIEAAGDIASHLARVIEREQSGKVQAHLAAIVETSPDAILSRALDGTIRSWNQGAERMFGYSAAEVVGKNAPIVPEDRIVETQRNHEFVNAGNTLSQFETERITRDGRRIQVAVSAAPIVDAGGKVSGVATIVRDITERKRAEEERTHYLNRLRALSRRLVETQETERRRLAAELHDRIGQNLTALTINLNIVSSQLSPEAAAQHAARLEDSQALVEATIETVRNVISELRPTALDDYGLRAALRWYGRQFEKRSGVLTRVEGEDLFPRPRSEVEAALYRIAQEALNNTLKHARARCATLRLDADAARVTLTVADDGAGFDPASVEQHGKHPGWGLLMMRERAESVGGRIMVDSALAHGTRVVVEIDRPA